LSGHWSYGCSVSQAASEALLYVVDGVIVVYVTVRLISQHRRMGETVELARDAYFSRT
jgi:hypothetical protein